MPQVASSSTKVHAPNRAQSHTARTSQAAGPAASAPFASLLDDTTASPAPQQQQQPQTDASKAEAAKTGSTPATAPPVKADTAPVQPTGEPVPGAPTVPVVATDPTLVPAKPKTATDAASSPEPVKAKDQTKDPAKADAGADQGNGRNPTVSPDPSTIADTTVAATIPATVAPPAASQQPVPTSVVPAPAVIAIDTTVSTQTAPMPQAFVAATAAQKLQPLDDTAKSQPVKAETAKPGSAKPAATADAVTAPPANADDQSAAQPSPQAGAPDPKIAADAHGSAAKLDTQPHHTKGGAAAAAAITVGGATPTGGDAGGAGQTTAASATLAATTAHATGPSGTAAAATQAAPAPPQAVAVPLSGLAVEIAGRAHAGKNNFEIRLDPPELGRIEVKLSVDHQGQVTSHLIADRPDTLDLLRRDSSGLERALQDAGLKTAGDGLQFSLRDQSFSGGQQSGTGQQNTSHVVAQDDTLPAVDIPASSYTRYLGRVGGIDIRV